MHLTLSSWTWLAVTRFITYIQSVFFGVERLMTSVGECNKANSHGDESPPHETVDGRNPLLDNILSRGRYIILISTTAIIYYEFDFSLLKITQQKQRSKVINIEKYLSL